MHSESRVALITGGGSGIGRAAAITLEKRGFRLALTGRRRQALDETAELLGPGSFVCEADLTREPDVINLFRQVETHYGRLDLLFNNAGINVQPTAFEDFSLSDWHRVLESNLTSAFLSAREAFRLMIRQSPQGGRIINNGSISAMSPRPHAVAYTSSKHGISGLTKTIALEGRRFNISCGQIDIGNTATPIADQVTRGMVQADFTIRAEPTFDVQHVADAIAYMADLPLEVNVQSMTVIASGMPYVGRG